MSQAFNTVNLLRPNARQQQHVRQPLLLTKGSFGMCAVAACLQQHRCCQKGANPPPQSIALATTQNDCCLESEALKNLELQSCCRVMMTAFAVWCTMLV
jgi:hypothetical protein